MLVLASSEVVYFGVACVDLNILCFNLSLKISVFLFLNSWVRALSIELKDMVLGWAHDDSATLLVGGYSLIWATYFTLSILSYHFVKSTNWSFTSFLGNDSLVFWAVLAFALPCEEFVSFTLWFNTVTICLEYSVDTTDLSVTSEVTSQTSGKWWAFGTLSFFADFPAIWAIWKSTFDLFSIGNIEHWAL